MGPLRNVCIYRFGSDWSYDPLSQANPPTRHVHKRYFALGGLTLLFGVVAIWRILSPNALYTALDNYQRINPHPVALEGESTSITSSSNRAVVSTLYSDSYAIGVAVLGYSIRSTNVSARLILPYLEERVSANALCIVRAAGWEPHSVAFIPPPHHGEGVHPRFGDQFTKLNIWTFDQLGIKSLVYLDADTLVLRNFEELFELGFSFAAVPNVYGGRRGFIISFNAGVLAIKPSTEVFQDMRRNIATARYPPTEAEQAFLNVHYGAKGVRLPYVYNMNLAIKKRSSTLWGELMDEGKIVHYTLHKPFSRTVEGVSTREEEERRITEAEMREDGYFAEEFGWWRGAYNGL